ncbi:MAG: YraN family protein [Bacteroidota bacterium]|nr:YraN family protein [Bacteroidota bacterium]
MSKSHNFGKKAEQKVVDFLTEKDYQILERNWRFSHLEVDIIALHKNFIVIIEVKARKNRDLNFDEIITLKKQKNLINAAEKYLDKKDLDNELRFDVAFVSMKKSTYEIEYIENAFYSMLE